MTLTLSASDTAFAAVSGAMVGLGLTMIIAGWWGPPTTDDDPTVEPLPWRTAARHRVQALVTAARDRWGPAVARRIGATAGAFVVVGLITRWPVGALLAGIGAWALPGLWRPDADTQAGTDRLEAIAVWTEMLRDTLSAAAGLEQAVLATAAIAPEAISEPVAALAAGIRDGHPLEAALRQFAEEVDDPTADLVVTALVLASTRQARDLTGLLSTLAQAARDQVVLRLRVTAGRARVRASVRIVLLVTLAMVTGLVVLNRGYLTPYDTPAGQLVLLAVGGLFALAFGWLGRIAAIPSPPRVLEVTPPNGSLSAPGEAPGTAGGTSWTRS
jgi:Flp pilus assembly protein TadB